MPKFTVQAVEENQLLQPGEYSGVITKASMGLVQAGKLAGAEKMELTWRVDGKATVRDNLIWSESLLWKLSKFAVATGIAKAGDEIEIEPDNVVGLSCLVRITNREIEGKNGKQTVNQISDYRAGATSEDPFAE